MYGIYYFTCSFAFFKPTIIYLERLCLLLFLGKSREALFIRGKACVLLYYRLGQSTHLCT